MANPVHPQLSDRREFERIEVGDHASLSHTIVADDVASFAALTGDYNPLHVDPDYASTTEFGKPVVHGMLSASFISTLIGMLLPGPGALWTSQTLQFRAPAFVGDTITVRGVVKQKSIGARLLALDIAVTNQQGQELVSGQATVKVIHTPKAREMTENNAVRTIVITGAAGGIGGAIARTLGAKGHNIIINYLKSADAAKQLATDIEAAGGKAILVPGDVTEPETARKLFESARASFGGVNGFVHAAGPANAPTTFEALSWSQVEEQVGVHVGGAFNCAKEALPLMLEGGGGSMVFIGSIYADGTPPVQQLRYTVAKAGLAALARSLAAELGPRGIRVNVVSPGMTRTRMIESVPEKVKMLAKAQTPLRQLADPIDVAHAVEFLLSPSAAHITGETVRVCGGITMV
ncbi:MAG: SDR family oxidoreductase [Gemmatimonadota bacterium]|nr:SDR family oxidoreductase [Gemmatimonadota bacterium]